ncbi:MAG TPA: aldehyde dehydrogenase family protein, partial [Leptospiraceae bacterium]|nr:aldehyde dehydrogenase family protein [Leptospiraceae bacterium]
NGNWRSSSEKAEIVNPANSEKTAEASNADESMIDECIRASISAFNLTRKSSRFIRSRILKKIADGILKRQEELVSCISDEAGKPCQLALAETERAYQTFLWASEEVRRFGAESFPMDIDAYGRNFYDGKILRCPLGVILAVSPFNFPLNLAAHKVAPALACGASVILKPPPAAPGASVILGELFLEAVSESREESFSESALQIIHCSNQDAEKLATDERISVLSFTGSDRVGWHLKTIAGRKKVLLELGGTACTAVFKDADLNQAAERCIFGAFSYSGQVCISIQKILIEDSIYDKFCREFKEKTQKLNQWRTGEKEGILGPLINRNSMERILSWVQEALDGGAKLLTEIRFEGNFLSPIVMEDVPKNCRLQTEEIFGPVVIMERFSDMQDAVLKINSSRYGLQNAVFTEDRQTIHFCTEEISSGSVLINEIPTYRADHMPYGGVKDSGMGKEGIRYAMNEFTFEKLILEKKPSLPDC